MNSQKISVTIIALNEKDHIAKAIESAKWADEILVVDSGSSDGTVEIAKNMGVRVLHREWQGYGSQKNFAQENAKNDWILNIDADEEVSPELATEIQEIFNNKSKKSDFKGYRFPRKTFYLGRWIRHGGWYPNYLVRLADRRHARWTEPEIHEALQVSGSVGSLQSPILHYTFDDIEDQVRTNLKYARYGSNELRKKNQKRSLTRLLLKPLGKFIETYILKRGFLDGLPGLIISLNAAHSMFLKYAYLFEKNETSSD